MALPIAVIRAGSLRSPLLKLFICSTIYPDDRPASCEDSACPIPDIRWQEPQPGTSGGFPCTTAGGAEAYCSGNQTGGLNRSSICACVKALVLPGTCRGPLSSSF